jgi:hypothetical protein
MSDERAAQLSMVFEFLLRREIDRHRMNHEEAIQVVAITLGTLLADLPTKKDREHRLAVLMSGIAEDVREEAADRIVR